MTADQMKRLWLRPSMSGTDQAIMLAAIASLPDSRPSQEGVVSAEDAERLKVARDYLAELFLRGVSMRRFDIETGLTGFPVFPEQPGMQKQLLMSRGIPVYFNLWTTDKDATTSATAIKNTIQFLKTLTGDYSNAYTMQLFIDVDTTETEFPMPLEGLTRLARCVEFNLSEAESVFAFIERSCAQLVPHAQRSLRVGLGKFGPDEFTGFSNGNIFSARIPFDMGSEWLLFKNIHRRAGRFGWFWRLVAKRQDRKDKV